MHHPPVKVFIHYFYESIADIRLVGNTKNTGNWDPSQSIPLVFSESCYTVSLLLTHNTIFEYKYIIISDESCTWESFPNRKLMCKYSVINVNDFCDSGLSEVTYESELPKAHNEMLPEIEEGIKFSISDSIIFANFNLPVKVFRNPLYGDDNLQEQWVTDKNKGIWLPVLYDITQKKNIDIMWIGYPGIIIEDEEEQNSLTEFLVEKHRCFPIFLPESLLNDFNNFSSSVLMPVFHNLIPMSAGEIPQYSLEQWEIYKNVNSIFADAIMANYKSQLIWINDYALMLCPSFVSRRIHELLNIGFYLQCPFPSADVFKMLPHCEAILHSLLTCDLVGFHSYDYASDFLKACKVIIGIEHHFSKEGYLLVEYFGRHIMLRIEEIGIEIESVKEIMEKPEFSKLVEELQEKYYDSEIILGIDPATKLSGVTLKLQAFKSFLHVTKSSKVVLLQYLTRPKILHESEANNIRHRVSELQQEINELAGRNAVEIVYQDLNQMQRYSLMSISYAMFNSCLKDSVCLMLYEYIFVNQGTNKPIIVSETAGISKSLRSFIKINPYSSASILEALTSLQLHEGYHFRLHDIQWVIKNTMQTWAINFLGDLKKARKNPKLMQYMKHGMGDKMKLIALRKNFHRLDIENLLVTYKRARFRAMFFDNEGTLTELPADDKGSAKPKPKMLDCLADLSMDPLNLIFIITGRQKKKIQKVYNLPNLGLAAEYGSFIKWSDNKEWECRNIINTLWKDTAKHIILSYVARTEGAIIEEKECSVVFRYNNCDPDHGTWQAKELAGQLDVLLAPFIEECEVVEGICYIEVKPRMINKGLTVEYILEECNKGGITFDFVMVLGDDSADEEMFKILKQLVIHKSPVLSPSARCFSCTLGRKPTEAEYYINDSSEVLQYLEALRHWTKRDPEAFANWNTSLHVVDIVKAQRRFSIESDTEL